MKILFIILAFLFGLYICLNYSNKEIKEYFENNDNPNSCPNILIQKGNVLWLYNNKKNIVPGINPKIFEKLSDYVKYVEWQQQNNIECPVLYYQEIQTTQGETAFRKLPDLLDKKSGLPSFNKLNYKKKTNDYIPIIRKKTSDFYPIDKIYNESSLTTDNAMDTNWNGPAKSRKNVQKNKFLNSYKNQYNMKLDKNNKSRKNKKNILFEEKKINEIMKNDLTHNEILSNHIAERNNFDMAVAMS